MALNAYLDVLVDMYRIPGQSAPVWKEAVRKSDNLRRKYNCSKAHLNHIAQIRHSPQWRNMCQYNKMYKCLDDLANEPQEIFAFDEIELN